MKVLRDTWLVFTWSLGSTLRGPVWAIIGLFQPLCYLLLFGPLLQPLSGIPGFPPGGAQTVFTPGVMVMMGIFGTVFAGFGLIAELHSGFIERLLTTPLSRLALPLGRILLDILLLLLQALFIVLISLPFGLHVNLAGLLLTLGLLALLGLCLSACSYGLALGLRDVNALSSTLQTLTLPIFLLSGITLPLTLAPPVLRVLGNFNPIAYAVNAARALFLGDLGSAAVIEGFVLLGVLALLALFWVTRAFRHATA